MPRRGGWELAQLRTSFAGDPEFQRLSRAAPDDLHFLAAVGLWAIGLAQAWRDDEPRVGDTLAAFDVPAVRELLASDHPLALVTADGELRGYDKWTEQIRADRAADAARKARARRGGSPPESGGHEGSPTESSEIRGVQREVEVEVEVEERDIRRDRPSTLTPREAQRPARPRANVTGFATPFGAKA